jgi:capsid protein
MPWINPKQEADAWQILVEAGFSDEAEVARARGRNPQELKRTRTAEIQTNRDAKLVFTSDAFHRYYAKQGAASEQPK